MSVEGLAFQFQSFLFSSSFALSQSITLEVITLNLIFAEKPSIWQGQYKSPFDFFLWVTAMYYSFSEKGFCE